MDVPAITHRSVIGPGMEISATDRYVESLIDHRHGDSRMVFLNDDGHEEYNENIQE